MPQYGEIVYNPTDSWIATYDPVAGEFSLPVRVDYIQQVTFEYESDTDEIKTAGLIAESLAVITKGTGELSQASLDFAGMTVLTGYGSTEFNTTPNRYSVQDIVVGGEGLPYFAMITSYAATNGANALVGFAKMKLETVPGWTVDQNQFRIGSANFNAFPPSTTYRKAARIVRYETAAIVPQTAEGFLEFFTLPTPMFDAVA